jgi:hypothetical protein
VTFSTDIFHPLITPLTTYTYTTDIQDNGTVSATDEERLPPGGFSLRHGFPDWFGRASRTRQQHHLTQTPPRGQKQHAQPPGSTPQSASSPGSTAATPSFMQTRRPAREVPAAEVLRYVASTFDSEDVLDAVPLEAAGNPGAWHAWRTRQRRRGRAPTVDVRGDVRNLEVAAAAAAAKVAGAAAGAGSGATTTKRPPGEWNWDGVWEERVKKGIATSLSDVVLYGGVGGGADDVVSLQHFPSTARRQVFFYFYDIRLSAPSLFSSRIANPTNWPADRLTSSAWTTVKSRASRITFFELWELPRLHS